MRELRWRDRDHGWEVLIPSVAFENSGSSFFGQKPFRLILPVLLDLYKYLMLIDRHRGVLLRGAQDPGMLFVKTVKTSSIDAAYIDHLLGGVADRHPALWDLQPLYQTRCDQGLAAAWTA